MNMAKSICLTPSLLAREDFAPSTPIIWAEDFRGRIAEPKALGESIDDTPSHFVA
jgi:hypothetical protein